MNELLDTERVYVEELLCVLEVSPHLGMLGCPMLAAWGGLPTPNGLVSTEKHNFTQNSPRLDTTQMSVHKTRPSGFRGTYSGTAFSRRKTCCYGP